jgi:hypothetical protein
LKQIAGILTEELNPNEDTLPETPDKFEGNVFNATHISEPLDQTSIIKLITEEFKDDTLPENQETGDNNITTWQKAKGGLINSAAKRDAVLNKIKKIRLEKERKVDEKFKKDYGSNGP